MTKPISPHEIRKFLPEFVIEAVNELLAENIDAGGRATFRQKALIARIRTKTEITFDDRWLDIETTYRDAGWDVYYDGPAYNESYDAYFVFSQKGGRK